MRRSIPLQPAQSEAASHTGLVEGAEAEAGQHGGCVADVAHCKLEHGCAPFFCLGELLLSHGLNTVLARKPDADSRQGRECMRYVRKLPDAETDSRQGREGVA